MHMIRALNGAFRLFTAHSYTKGRHRDVPVQAQRGGGRTAATHSQPDSKGTQVISNTPWPRYCQERTISYILYRRLSGSQGRSERHVKSRPPPSPRLDPRTVQPAATRNTDTVTVPLCRMFKKSSCHCQCCQLRRRLPFGFLDPRRWDRQTVPSVGKELALYAV